MCYRCAETSIYGANVADCDNVNRVTKCVVPGTRLLATEPDHYLETSSNRRMLTAARYYRLKTEVPAGSGVFGFTACSLCIGLVTHAVKTDASDGTGWQKNLIFPKLKKNHKNQLN